MDVKDTRRVARKRNKMEYEYRKAIARNERMLFKKDFWVKEKILSFKSVFKKKIEKK